MMVGVLVPGVVPEQLRTFAFKSIRVQIPAEDLVGMLASSSARHRTSLQAVHFPKSRKGRPARRFASQASPTLPQR